MDLLGAQSKSRLPTLVYHADRITAELMRRGLNPVEVRVRDVLAYIDNFDQVMRADAQASLRALAGGEGDGD